MAEHAGVGCRRQQSVCRILFVAITSSELEELFHLYIKFGQVRKSETFFPSKTSENLTQLELTVV